MNVDYDRPGAKGLRMVGTLSGWELRRGLNHWLFFFPAQRELADDPMAGIGNAPAD
jgi:hypothetical protein